jgi:hypothetical protein
MYLARYGEGCEQFSQLLLRFPVVLFEPADKPRRWLLGLRHAAEQLLAAPDVDFAFRIGVAGRRLQRALLLIAPSDREDELPGLAAAFLHANRVEDNSVDFCLSRDEHDGTLQAFPGRRAWVRNDSYPLGEQELACDFQVAPALEELLGLALQRDLDFAVQVNARRFHPAPEDLRAARKNLVRLEADRSVPPAVLDLQRRIVNRLAAARFVTDQFVGAGTAAARDLVLRRLGERFTADYGHLGFGAAPFEVGADTDLDAPLTTGFHSSLFDDVSPVARAGMAVEAAPLQEYLTWHPPETWDPGALANAVREPDAEPDFLRRMEARLKRIEGVWQTRRLTSDACEEFRKALHIHRADPLFALVKARQILEEIIKRVYQEQKATRQVKPLFNMIEELIQAGTVFPRPIASYLHTVRVLGNLVVHSGPDDAPAPLSEGDLELSLLMTLHIVEWYLLQYARAG